MSQEPNKQDETSSPQPKRRRHWITLTIGLAGLLILAPTIVGYTPLRQQILPALAPQYPAEIHVESASLSWLSRVSLRNVTFRDTEDREFLKIDEITTGETLWQLLLNSDGVHPIALRGVVADVRLREDGSNAEDIMAAFIAEPSAIWPGVALDITDSQVKISSTQHPQEVVWDDLNLSAKKSAAQGVPYVVTVQTDVEGGHLESKLSWTPPAELSSPAAGDGELVWQMATFPLDALRPILDRAGIPDEVSAQLTSDCKTVWNTSAAVPSYHVDGVWQTGPLKITSAAISGKEPLRADYFQSSMQVTIKDELIQVKQFGVDTDLAKLRVTGEAAFADFTNFQSPTGLYASLSQRDFDMQGQLDLAKLAAALPQTLRVREGTEITAGTVEWRIAGVAAGETPGWKGQLVTSQIAATHEGRQITWDEPIQVAFSTTPDEVGAPTLRLKCQSDFLQASMKSSDGRAAIRAECDLDRLAAEAGRFLDLNDLKLAGKLQAHVDLLRQTDQFSATGQLAVQQLRLANIGGLTWEEPQFACQCRVAGKLQNQDSAELSQAALQLSGHGYELKANLTGPTVWNAENTAVPMNLQLQGDMGKVAPQLLAMLGMKKWKGAGQVDLKTALTVSPSSVSYRDAEIAIADLLVEGPSLHLNETSVEMASSGTLDLKSSQFRSTSTVLSTPNLNARAQQVQLDYGAASPRVTANIDFVGGLPDLLEMIQFDPQTAATIEGKVSARVNLQHADGTQRLKSDLVVDDFAVLDSPTLNPGNAAVAKLVSTSQPAILWEEPQLIIASDVTYQAAEDRLKITDTQVSGNEWKMRGAGELTDLSKSMKADVNGTLKFDWQRLLAAHRQLVGTEIQVSGQGPFPFSLSGPLAATSDADSQNMLERIDAQLTLSWQAVELFGLQAGKAEFATRLKNGVYRVKPLDIPVNEGRLTASPRIHFDADPMRFALPNGPVIQNVRLSPQMCHTWLKFVAPMLADSTRVDGRLSLSTTSVRIPLDDWQDMKSLGELTIHSAEVRPGPLAQQLLDVAEQVKMIVRRGEGGRIVNSEEAWMSIDPQKVAFRVSGGRVHHDRLQIRVQDFVLRTSGSVGLDESIDLIVEVPIQDEWLKNDRYLAALKGQVIPIPIKGTLTRPQINQNVLQELGRQIGTAAGSKLIESELQNQLQRLLDK